MATQGSSRGSHDAGKTTDATQAKQQPPVLDIEQLRSLRLGTYTHHYTERDLALYALGVGCSAEKDLKYVWEGHPEFQPLPTYAIIAAHPASTSVPLHQHVPSFDMRRALHGEQYLELKGPLPRHGRLVSRPQLLDVRDKGPGKGIVTLVRTVTHDADTGHEVAVAEFTGISLSGGGSFRSPWPAPPRSPSAVAEAAPPQGRDPDATVSVPTGKDQAALYRLSGDLNPLHIDPATARRIMGSQGTGQPILHGLCTMAVSVKAVVDALVGGDMERLRAVKVRFAAPVYPGEVLEVRAWWEQPPQGSGNNSGGSTRRIIFETRKPDGKRAISNALVEVAPVGWKAAGSQQTLPSGVASKL